jgi:hypothetical protein
MVRDSEASRDRQPGSRLKLGPSQSDTVGEGQGPLRQDLLFFGAGY